MGKPKKNKLTKLEYRALLKKKARAMSEVRKAKKMIKKPQDPVVGSTDIQNVTVKNDNLECKIIKEEIDIVFEPEEVEKIVESKYDTKKSIYGSVSEAPCETQFNEEIDIVFKPEEIEQIVESSYDTQKSIYGSESDAPCVTQSNEEIDIVFKPEEIEQIVESSYDTKKSIYGSENDAPCVTQSNEDLWVVRRQLCRGCHSDGAFWSLQTTTEGDTYGDLLQTYLNIQLCPVSMEEVALSAICTLCAARVREARAFSAQARAAEERFTRFYKQNRIRALNNEVVEIKEDVPKIINEVDYDFEITNDIKPDTATSDLVDDDYEITEDIATDNATSDIALAKKAVTKEDTQKTIKEVVDVLQEPIVRCDKPAPKKFYLTPSDYQRVGKSFKCTRCAKHFHKSYIRKHVKNVHLKYTCPHCDKTLDKRTFNRHIKDDNCAIYDENSTKACALSPFDFERVGTSYNCTQCVRQFRSYSEFRHHFMIKHLKLPRYTCSHCDKTFHGLVPFNKHKFVEHSIDERIKCNACDWFTFGLNAKLTKHMKVFHMLGVKLVCPDCDYVCFTQKALRDHAVKHSNVREHHCKYCKKSFLRKTNLNEHEKIHTEDKRKVCNVCGQAFVQRASLTYHMAKHHPDVRL